MIKNFASYLSARPLQRHLFFLGLAILACIINGYHFGTFDQVFHITFLKKFFNPNLYPNDPFLSLRWYHFSYFWFPFISLYKANILEISMFIVHILTVYGTIWMFWEISDLLFKDKIAKLLLVIALVFPHLGLPGFQIIEFSLLNRTFVLPFLLGSIYLYLKNKKHLAFLLLGLMFNLHAIYAVFLLCMFLCNEAFTFKWQSWWKPCLQMIIFIIAGMPVLLWRAQTGSGIDFSLRPEMLDIAARGLLFTVYYPIAPINHVIGIFLAGIGTVWAFILGYSHTEKTYPHKTIKNFVIGVGILLLISMFTSYLLPITILLQMQLLRVGVFLLYFSMLYLSFFIAKQYQSSNMGGFLLLCVSFVIHITPIITILIWILLKNIKQTKQTLAWILSLTVVFQILTAIIALQTGLWSPGIHIYGPESDWHDVQEWAKNNTTVDNRFITPPHMFGHYIPDWRVFSERSAIATIPEMMEIPFDPDFIESFTHRFEAVAPGAIESFNGNYMQTLKITRNAFYANNPEDFVNLSCQFSADFLVVETTNPYPFRVLYQNSQFIVYQLPGCP